MIRQLAFEIYILDFLKERNIPTSAVLSQIKSLDRLERLHQLARYADEKCNEPLLGLLIGNRASNFSYGVLGYALVNAPTLIASHRLMLKHLWILQEKPADAALLELTDSSLTLTYKYPPVWPDIPNVFLDLFFAANLKRSRELTGGSLPGTSLRLTRCRPENGALYEKTLGIKVSFDQADNQLIIPRAIALSPLDISHLGHSVPYRQHCERILSRMKKSTGLTDCIRRLILENRGRSFDMNKAADILHLETRTLRRRLKAEGTSFRYIQQEVRCHLACTYLISTDLSLSDIASLIGYHDPSTFNRAFIGWLGTSPASYRLSHKRSKDVQVLQI